MQNTTGKTKKPTAHQKLVGEGLQLSFEAMGGAAHGIDWIDSVLGAHLVPTHTMQRLKPQTELRLRLDMPRTLSQTSGSSGWGTLYPANITSGSRSSCLIQ